MHDISKSHIAGPVFRAINPYCERSILERSGKIGYMRLQTGSALASSQSDHER